jgi:hypothetical protein
MRCFLTHCTANPFEVHEEGAHASPFDYADVWCLRMFRRDDARPKESNLAGIEYSIAAKFPAA